MKLKIITNSRPAAAKASKNPNGTERRRAFPSAGTLRTHALGSSAMQIAATPTTRSTTENRDQLIAFVGANR
jgi:hypothetical protein